MSESLQKPRPYNPNAPQIPHSLYRYEKIKFAGTLIGTIFYGITVIMFFQCMAALFDRTRRNIKWPLVVHTTLMFFLVTIYTAITLNLELTSNIGNREFPGVGGILPPGPTGYQDLLYPKATNIVSIVVCLLNNWLADGLLLYRCYIIYSKTFWVIAFPCLMYLASFAIGIEFVYQSLQPGNAIWLSATTNGSSLQYYSISFALNILLTLMIIGRLVFFNRRIRKAMNAPVKLSGLYKIIVTALIESYALYTVTFLLFLGSWATVDPIAGAFFFALIEVQVIAPFLITLRIANQNGSTNVTVISGNTGSIHFRSQGKSASGDEADLCEDSVSSMGTHGGTRVELAVGIETALDIHQGDCATETP